LVSQSGREDDDVKVEEMGASSFYIAVTAEVMGNINTIKNVGSFDCSKGIQHLRLNVTWSQTRTISLRQQHCAKCASEKSLKEKK
jgi:hypothetical protein